MVKTYVVVILNGHLITQKPLDLILCELIAPAGGFCDFILIGFAV